VFLLAIEGAGNWRTAAEILFERKSLFGNIEESDKEGEGVTTNAGASVETSGILWSASDQPNAERLIDKAGTLNCNNGQRGGYICPTIVSSGPHAVQVTNPVLYENRPTDSRITGPLDIAPTMTSRFGTGGGNIPLVNQEPITFQPGNLRRDAGADPSTVATTTLKATPGDQMPHIAYSIREDAKANNFSATPLEVTPALQALRPSVQSHHAQTFVAQQINPQNRPREHRRRVAIIV
jgi:hypothetical protein